MTRNERPDRPGRHAADLDIPLIVHSHLRWDFVWQRPQQLLSRYASTAPVLFVEEPIFLDDVRMARLDLTTPLRNLVRAVPHLPTALRGDYDEAVRVIRSLVQAAVGDGGTLEGRFDAPVQWFYTPMPAPAMLGAFDERGVVYDCMDELAQFRFAPTDLPQRERQLLASADVVFTGGYRLYEAKAAYHGNVHFFGCGVDAAHFAKARLSDTPLPADVASIGRPIMGYFGVIDERLDYGLLRQLAETHKDYTLVMVGPVVKVDPAELPRAENIHWLGQRQYAELPAYVKAYDVCLMPFALNEATEYINPTKTLEYMAAGKPIVSTAVPDVVRNFTPIVRVARSRDGFVAAVRHAMTCPNDELIAQGIGKAKDNSWESIVGTMRRLIATAIEPQESELAIELGDEWGARRGTARAVGQYANDAGEEMSA